jgi:glycerophosphoryl diester phosphodiesterase
MPRLHGHRVASAAAPENTIRAFELAMKEGADGVELDVMRCRTGEVFVFHDDDLFRLCGERGDPRTYSWSALQALRIGGERIPLLDDVLEAVGREAIVNIELKSATTWGARVRDDGLAGEVGKIIVRHALGARALVSSFDPLLLSRFHRRAPNVAVGLLFCADQALPLRRAWAAPLVGAVAVHPESVLVDERQVRRWRARGYAVNVWTVDDPAELRYLASLDVDTIITNRPAAAREALAGASARKAAREAS